jgi:hypothetical protein
MDQIYVISPPIEDSADTRFLV